MFKSSSSLLSWTGRIIHPGEAPNGNQHVCVMAPDAGPDLAEVVDDVQVEETSV